MLRFALSTVGEKAHLPPYLLRELGSDYEQKILQKRGHASDSSPLARDYYSTESLTSGPTEKLDDLRIRRAKDGMSYSRDGGAYTNEERIMIQTFETNPSTAGHRLAQWFIGHRVQDATSVLESISKLGRDSDFEIMYSILIQDIREAAQRSHGTKREYLLNILKVLSG